MHTFWVKVLSCVLVVTAIFGYSSVVQSRQQSEQIAQLELDLEQQKQIADAAQSALAAAATATDVTETVTETVAGEPSSLYHDGVYTGEAEEFGGTITVEAEIADGELIRLDVVSADQEDAAYLEAAMAVTDAMLEAQSADVDTVSGATYSSNGIIQAAAQALGKAKDAA
ncbi:MAG: FMN-binding protein [Ruminococcus sp.]|nr:FMN-binding protein [Ruminococcus sp.]